jgi:hypothetical protein
MLISKEEKKKIVFRSTDVVIFEGGFWMENSDYRKTLPDPDKYLLDVDEKTHQIKLCFAPK